MDGFVPNVAHSLQIELWRNGGGIFVFIAALRKEYFVKWNQ